MLIQYFPETPGHGMPAAPPDLDSQNFLFLGTCAEGREGEAGCGAFPAG